MIKIKPILPVFKEKKRYLVFEVISDSPITNFNTISNQISQTSQEFLGKLGIAKAGIQIVDKYNPKLQRGIIKVNHKHIHDLKSDLTFVKKIDNKNVIIKSIKVSGILNKAKKLIAS